MAIWWEGKSVQKNVGRKMFYMPEISFGSRVHILPPPKKLLVLKTSIKK
jgi:hypothetical protein